MLTIDDVIFAEDERDLDQLNDVYEDLMELTQAAPLIGVEAHLYTTRR